MRWKIAVASVAVVTLVGATPALAATSVPTISVTKAGVAATSMQSGDNLDVVATGTVLENSPATNDLIATWSEESLRLLDPSSVVAPQGWDVSYTTDGTNWEATAPETHLIRGVKATGTVQASGPGIDLASPSGRLISSVSQFQGSTKGDGYDVEFAGDRVFNVFHHAGNVTVDCHFKDGASCYFDGGVRTFTGYNTPQASSSFYDAATNKLYAMAQRRSDRRFGFLCLDVTNDDQPVLCPSAFTPIDSGDFARSWTEWSSATRVGNQVWSIDSYNSYLMCFDVSTGTACSGKSLTAEVPRAYAYQFGRVVNYGGKVYFTQGVKLGCIDPTTVDYCGGIPPVDGAGPGNVYAPFPVLNSSGGLLGVCVYTSLKCINTAGALVNMSSIADIAALYSFASTTAVPYFNTINAGQWALSGTRLYLNKGPNAQASDDVYCYDFSTQAACAGFNGTGVGQRIYTITVDPVNPNCIWTNGDWNPAAGLQGRISSFDGITGQPGCNSGRIVADYPVATNRAQYSCTTATHKAGWQNIRVTPPAGVSLSDLLVSITNTDGTPTDGWQDLVPDASGNISLASLDPTDVGNSPSFKLSTAAAISGSDLTKTGLTVSWDVDDPQLCFTVTAVEACPADSAGPLDVPDGIIEVISGVPSTGAAAGATITLAGTNTSNLCKASVFPLFLPTYADDLGGFELAHTGGPDSTPPFAAGVALLCAGLVGVTLARLRRRSTAPRA
jgi:hypothetical protein